MNSFVHDTVDVSPEDDYFLLSFAPSAGIGFYHYLNQIHEFDLVSGTDSICEGKLCSGLHLEQDQVDAKIRFRNLEALKGFARQEYLRDKKNTYLSLILIEGVRPQLLRQILEFLNEDELIDLPLSEGVIPVFYKTASRAQAQRVLIEARDFPNVVGCFGRELPALAFEAMEPTLEGMMRERRLAIPFVTVMTQLVLAAGRIPRRILDLLRRVIDLTGRERLYTGTQWVRAIFRLAEALDYQPPALAFSLALKCDNSREMSQLYEAALTRNKADIESKDYAGYPDQIIEFGHAVLQSGGSWIGEWGWPFPWRAESRQGSLLSQWGLRLAFENRGKVFAGMLPAGLPFVLEFGDRRGVVQRQIEDPESTAAQILASRTAFWTACFVDPETVLSRFRPEPSLRYRSMRDVVEWIRLCYELWGSNEVVGGHRETREPASLWSVCFPDLLNFVVMPHFPGFWTPVFDDDIGELDEMVVEAAIHSRRQSVSAYLGIPDPLTVLMNNLLSIRLQAGKVRSVQAIAEAMEASARSIDTSGFFRFVL